MVATKIKFPVKVNRQDVLVNIGPESGKQVCLFCLLAFVSIIIGHAL